MFIGTYKGYEFEGFSGGKYFLEKFLTGQDI